MSCKLKCDGGIWDWHTSIETIIRCPNCCHYQDRGISSFRFGPKTRKITCENCKEWFYD